MHVHSHQIPSGLCRLIEQGIWPRTEEAFLSQNLELILGEEKARKISPDDREIILMKPPFHTIADEVDGGNRFWVEGLTNLGEIDYRKAVIIADFGLGSDSPIILYYGNEDTPSVMYLKWSGNGAEISHAWVECHDSFDEFASEMGLYASLIPR